MRLLFDCNDIPQIEEFQEFDVSPVWNSATDDKNPIGFYLQATRATGEVLDSIGEWVLDGKPETYKAALDNYLEVVEQLLTKGYARTSDFKNFEWY